MSRQPVTACRAALLVALAWSSLTTAEITIRHHDAVRDLVVTPRADAAGQRKPDGRTTRTVTFQSFGRAFTIELWPNTRLVSRLPVAQQAAAGDVELLVGTSPALPGSWARLSIVDGVLSGAFWDGAELYLLERGGRLAGLTPAPAADALVMIRARDVVLPIDHPLTAGGNARASRVVEESAALARQKAAASSLPLQSISLGLVLDAEYNDRYSLEDALPPANIADGIFSEQADTHIDLEYIESYEEEPDPFTASSPSALLGELTELRAATPELSALGLTHLLTDIRLEGGTRGIAKVRSMCGSNDGTGLTSVDGSVFDALIMAHEIGHNLGAPHDGESGSACSETPPDFLMAATLNGSDRLSPCSLARIAAALADATCLLPVPISDLELEAGPPPADVYYGAPVEVSFLVNNIGFESTFDGTFDVAAGSSTSIALLEATHRSCSNPAPMPDQSCALGNLYAGETVTVELSVTPGAIGPVSLDALVAASNDTNAGNNAANVVLDVQPATDVSANGFNNVPGGIDIRPGGSVSFTAVVENNGDFDTGASIILYSFDGTTLSTAGNCDAPSQSRLECSLGTLPARASRSIEFEAHADPTVVPGLTETTLRTVHFEVTSSLYDPQPAGNHTQFEYRIWGAFRDMQTGFVEPPQSLDVGETREFTAFIRNAGPDPIARVVFWSRAGLGLSFGTPTADRGTCSTTGEWADCDAGQLDPDEEILVRVPYTGDVAGTYPISLLPEATGGLELDPLTASAEATIDVLATTPPPPPGSSSGGGGGGSVSLPFLLGLAAFAWRRSPAGGGRDRTGAGRVSPSPRCAAADAYPASAAPGPARRS